MMTMVRVWCAVIVLLTSAGSTRAQDAAKARDAGVAPVESVAPGIAAPAGHGWIVVNNSDGRGAMLLHLPPRSVAERSEAGGGAAGLEGIVRLAPGLSQRAERIAAWHNSVYVLLAEARVGPAETADYKRRIVTVGAVRSAAGRGGWEYPPGRAESAGALPARGAEVLAFGACRLGAVAMVRHGPRSEWLIRSGQTSAGAEPRGAAPPIGAVELAINSGAEWRSVGLPWAGESGGPPSGPFWLEGEGDELALYAFDSGASAVRSYRARVPAPPSRGESSVVLDWRRETLPFEISTGGVMQSLPTPDRVFRIDGVLIAAQYVAPERAVRLFWLSPDRPAKEGPSVSDVPRLHQFAPMNGSGRLCIVWSEESAAAGGALDKPAIGGGGGENRTGLIIREVSANTGKVLFAGPLKTDYWLSMRQYQMLAIMLVLVMASVVVFVLRAEPGGRLGSGGRTLPQGVALAEPGRRMLAMMLDYLPAALFVETLMALPTGSLILPSRMSAEEVNVWAIAAAFGIAAVHCTLGEWAFGRSLGKMLTGCAVASVRRPEPGTPGLNDAEIHLSRPAFWQCLARNLVKWAAPVLGIFVLLDSARRHPGDLLGRTMVLLTEIREGP